MPGPLVLLAVSICREDFSLGPRELRCLIISKIAEAIQYHPRATVRLMRRRKILFSILVARKNYFCPADVPDEDDLDFMSSASPLDDEIHYLVARGRVPGVYHHSKYREQIRDFPNGFAEVHPNKSAATAAWEAMCQDEPELPLGRDPEPTCGF